MKTLFHIPSHSLTATYHKVCKVLQGNDKIIFDAMTVITQGQRSRKAFIPPSNPHEFKQKHTEIITQLGYPNLLKGRDLAMNLMAEIWAQTVNLGGLPGLSNDDLLKAIIFKTALGDVKIRLTSDLHWAVEWSVSLRVSNVNDTSKILLDVQDRNSEEIVPAHILQLVHTAIQAYKQGMNVSAIALLAICVEGTLRDVLTTRGYSFDKSAIAVDEYPYTKASVSTDGKSYIITFHEAMPKPPEDFLLSTQGASTKEIQVRRVITHHSRNTKGV